MEKNQKPIQLPPGFRFHPSDEELIVYYLRNKVNKTPLPASIVEDVQLYKLNPWDLPKKSLFGDEEWYFFTPRDRKYPNGLRPNRMAASGYWKATGIDKPILTSCGSKVVGVKKGLVFYICRPPKGNKTGWIMHEYRLPESDHDHGHASSSYWPNKKDNKNSMRLDEWVLCRVRQKTGSRILPFGIGNGSSSGCSSSTVQKLQNSTTPNIDLVRENNPCQEEYCPLTLIPFLFGNSDDQEFHFPTNTAVSCVSFEYFEEGNNNASVCEHSFNIDNYNLKKRKLQMEQGGHEDNITQFTTTATNKNKVNNIYYHDDHQEQLPAPYNSDNDDYAHMNGIMISSYHLAPK